MNTQAAMGTSFAHCLFDNLLVFERAPAGFLLAIHRRLFWTRGAQRVVELDLADALHVRLLHLGAQIVLKRLFQNVFLLICKLL